MTEIHKKQERIVPVVLSGGVGTRLWPESRAATPKQFMALNSNQTMIQETVARVVGPRFASPIIICNESHRFMIAQQLKEMGVTEAMIVLEPVGRNTAPAVTLAALIAKRRALGEILLILPSDHLIGDTAAFRLAIDTAVIAANDGNLVAFGVKPDGPETGFGYIRTGARIQKGEAAWHAVARFREKPDAERARAYLEDGRWHWNSGMFLFPVETILDEINAFEPEMLAKVGEAMERSAVDLDFTRVEESSFAACPAKSIDVAVMERTAKAAVVPVDMRWSDLGSWRTLWQTRDKDDRGNATRGDVMAFETRSSLLRTDGPLLVTLGVGDLVVVATADAILVADKERSRDVGQIVDALRAEGRNEALNHKLVHRPWGRYRAIMEGRRFQVKQIVVNPGGVLSLQTHRHRAEHWIVVEGTAKVTRGDETFPLHENQSTYIPLGARHRLENPGKSPLRLIEVQSGEYLGEDDIVRLQDAYGRSSVSSEGE